MAEGLRERKKRETRQRISDIAMGLFMARGFDNVTVAEVARAADVSVNTVFNYFTTKEDLFADRHETAVDLPVRTLQAREPGESVVAAFRRDFFDAIDTRDWRYGLNPGADLFAKVVGDSPSLVARLRAIHEEREAALARAIADETDAGADDLTPRLAAAYILGTLRMLSDHAARGQLAGESWESVEPGLRAAAATAFDLLETGLDGFGERALVAGGAGDDRDDEGEDREDEAEA
ncbi:TetR/AcrR family transcriptional regulator [Nonomuraea maritima]|uniref:TetR/AcrR family transcriptional regulator n=1 Tax=Nonomuraea maritima TaxID=683260 RepID=UPI00371DAAF6